MKNKTSAAMGGDTPYPGRMDEDGCYFLADRLKNIIIPRIERFFTPHAGYSTGPKSVHP